MRILGRGRAGAGEGGLRRNDELRGTISTIRVPLPNDPDLPEFYVYRFEVARRPFYVGIGRSARASDRVRYVRRLMKREELGLPVKWDLSCSVIAGLLRAGCTIDVVYPVKGVVRAQALACERAEIGRLASRGIILANLQHNPRKPSSASEVVRAVLEGH
jgi:hypothetical protein